MCGKNEILDHSPPACPGSPPRVREKRSQNIYFVENPGITPACAGKTSRISKSYAGYWDHPRVCGKNRLCVVHLDCCLADHPRVCGKNLVHLQLQGSSPGSPPRVREKLKLLLWLRFRCRITPACAGKTFELRFCLSFYGDHPRVCGKNCYFCWYQYT